MADLQVLHHVAGDAGGAADHTGDGQNRRHASRAGHPDPHHENGGDQQGGEGQPGDRVVGAADEAHQVAGHGGEQEAEDDHDHGEQDGTSDAAGEPVVEEEHGNGQQADGHKDFLEVQVHLSVRSLPPPACRSNCLRALEMPATREERRFHRV